MLARLSQSDLSRSLVLTLVRRMRPAAPTTDKWFPPHELSEPNKQRWIRCLEEYDGPARSQTDQLHHRDASESYNRLDCVPMLGWLAENAGLPWGVVDAALREAEGEYKSSGSADAFRRVIPWGDVQTALLSLPIWDKRCRSSAALSRDTPVAAA